MEGFESAYNHKMRLLAQIDKEWRDKEFRVHSFESPLFPVPDLVEAHFEELRREDRRNRMTSHLHASFVAPSPDGIPDDRNGTPIEENAAYEQYEQEFEQVMAIMRRIYIYQNECLRKGMPRRDIYAEITRSEFALLQKRYGLRDDLKILNKDVLITIIPDSKEPAVVDENEI